MTTEFIRQLVDFVAKYGELMTDSDWKIFHRVYHTLEMRADDEYKKSQKNTKRLACPTVAVYNSDCLETNYSR